MKDHAILKEKMDKLINIMLVDGVQPSDLADNIFQKPYKKITIINKKDFFYLDLVFEEDIDDKIVKTTLRYTYNNDKKLIRIELINGKTKKVEWDRDSTVTQLIREIINILNTDKNNQRVLDFINSLPEYWQQKFSCQKVA
ncbi:MAG: hypothetical protein JRJ49_07465 [Deltaproteobacteria bacterium]|nr:hypothetical protein [Deltaproteobacteria bacterium]